MQVQAMGCWGLLQTLEARRGKVSRWLPKAVRESVSLLVPRFQTSSIGNYERINVYFFQPPILWYFIEAAWANKYGKYFPFCVYIYIWFMLIAALYTDNPCLSWSSVCMLHTHGPLLFNTSKLNNGFQKKPASYSIPLHLKGHFVGFALFYMLVCLLSSPQNSSYNAHQGFL